MQQPLIIVKVWLPQQYKPIDAKGFQLLNHIFTTQYRY